MIAEIHGKISSTGSNLSDRLEDKLTGNIFGNLRYLPYEKGLKLLLEEIIIYKGNSEELLDRICNLENSFISDKIEFWPSHMNAELDLSIDLEDLFIGVEVKYKSGLSSNDQLLRELKVINNKRNNKKGLLIFIAQGEGITEAVDVIDRLEGDSYLLDNISFAYITWEDIFEIYNKLNLDYYSEYEKVIIKDIVKLLKIKGFEKFKSFEIDKEYNIQIDFFDFDYKLKENFNFKFDIKVKEDFYEFG